MSAKLPAIRPTCRNLQSPQSSRGRSRERARFATGESQMGRIVAFLYGVAAYLVSFVTLLYAVGFVTGLVVPKTIDDGAVVPLAEAVIVNVLLMSLFAVQHSAMARQWFKRWWTRFVPAAVERSTYILTTSLVLALMFWQWRPIPAPVWKVDDPLIALAIVAVSLSGWLLVLASTFQINHFELFGLQQVARHLTGGTVVEPRFRTPALYRLVRHPVYLGLDLAFWAAPDMTAGHLL